MHTRKILFAIYFLGTLFSVSAQNHKIDSLRKVIQSEKDDSIKVDNLNDLSDRLHVLSKYDSSMVYCNKALELSIKLNYEKGRGDALNVIGRNYHRQGNYAAAIKSLQEGESVFRKIGYKKGIEMSLANMGINYDDEGFYPKALECYYAALTISKEIGYKRGIGSCLNNIATIYYNQLDYEKALDNYFKSLDVNKEINNKHGMATSLEDIGDVYHSEKMFDSALVYDLKSLTLFQKLGDMERIANINFNLGNIYIDKQQYDKSATYGFDALNINKQIGNKSGKGMDMALIGKVYLKEKKYNDSKTYLDSALMLLRKTGNKEHIRNTYLTLSELDSAKGDNKSGWEDYKSYINYRDSLINESTIKKTTQAEMNYIFTRKSDSAQAVRDKLNAISEKENQRQKVIRTSVVGGFSIMFVAAGLFFVQRRKISKEKKRSDELLLNILPEETAEELKATGAAKAKSFDMVTVMFTDFKDFTKIAEKLSPEELVAELHTIFQAFDNIIHNHNIEKIKTIGDSYMAAGGLPVSNQTHAKDMVAAALEIQDFMLRHNSIRAAENKPVFEARIGINTGPVVAGIVGIKKFAYDIWGDTVNLASRVESNGEPGRVNISGSTFELVKNDFICSHRGKIHAKNKGEVDMYFVERGKITDFEV